MEIKPIDFDVPAHMRGKKITYQKPEGWTDEQCSSLPSYQEVADDGHTQIISCWQIDDEALAQLILNKGKMWVWVHAPVMIPVKFTLLSPFPTPEQVQAFLEQQSKEVSE